jgi:hypothetical protein
MASMTKAHCFVGDLGLKKHELNTDQLKVYLTNATPNVTNSLKSSVADISNTNGYAPADITNLYSATGGTGTMTSTDVTWTAAGGTFGPFRYVVLYNETATDDPLIGWWDYGSNITLNDTETFTVDFGASVLTIA